MNKFKKGDSVKVITGKDKGKTGQITEVLPKVKKVIVEQINIAKKHQKKSQEGQGKIVEITLPIDWSNVIHLSGKDTVSRVSYKFENGEKNKVARKTGKSIGS